MLKNGPPYDANKAKQVERIITKGNQPKMINM